MDRKPLKVAIAAVLLAGLFTGFSTFPVHAACSINCWALNQDAFNGGQTDVSIQTSASDSHNFRIGAILTHASSANPLTIFGWQFVINYNATEFTARGDPSATSLYPDGAADTALLGAQTTSGTVNWAGMVSGGRALSGTTNNANGANGAFTVFLTIIAPNTAVTITADTLFANVAFELNSVPSPSIQSFTITNVIFVDSSSNTIPGVHAGGPITETITDIPPAAIIAATHETTGSPDCVPITGAVCTAFAFKFDGSTSSDADGTIANPSGYFWDFGDGTQNLGVTGSIVVHDYAASGTFNATLRVVDNVGDTGSARDALGNVILNMQPSHTQIINLSTGTTLDTTTTTVSCSPSSVTVNTATSCTATVTDTSAGPITPTGPVGFTSSGAGTFSPMTSCNLSGTTSSGTCNVEFTPSTTGTDTVTGNYAGDSAHTTSSGIIAINISQASSMTTVWCTPAVLKAGSSTTCTATVVPSCSASCPVPTGTAAFASNGAGIFSSTTCTLISGSSSSSCSVTFTPSAAGTDTITASYSGNPTYLGSSGTTSIKIRGHFRP